MGVPVLKMTASPRNGHAVGDADIEPIYLVLGTERVFAVRARERVRHIHTRADMQPCENLFIESIYRSLSAHER